MVRKGVAADMDVVIVPVWRRAGFATACLRRLELAADDDVRVLVSVDCGHDEDTLAAALKFAAAAPKSRVVTVRNLDYPTGSYNVFTAMQDVLGWVSPDDRVHVLEEDILIGRGYFDYHRSAWDVVGPAAYSVSACENVFLPDAACAPDWPTVAYLAGAFQVWGSSFRPERIEAILRRLRPNYFPEMQAAMVEEFGEANTLRTGPLYDGVMANDMAACGAPGVFPFVPRAYHAGFEGISYGPTTITGSPDEQADRIIQMTGPELKALCTLEGARFRPIDLDHNPGPVTKVGEW